MSRRFLYLLDSISNWQPMTRTKINLYCGAFVVLVASLFLVSCSPRDPISTLAEDTRVIAVEEELATATPVRQITEAVPVPTSTSPPVAIAETTTAEPSLPSDLAITADDIQLFPVPKIISGDRVTFQVQPHVPVNITVENVQVDIYVDEQNVSSGNLGWRNWEGTAQGIYEWVWNTSGRPGKHEIRVVLDAQDVIKEGDEDPDNNETTFSVDVRKAGERPLEERDVSWITAEIDCCFVHVPTRSAAYRDLPNLLSHLDSAVSEASGILDEFPEKKIEVYFIERTIGQGGYASTEMVVVYNDRLYIGGEINELLKHEAVHIIDRQFAPQRIKLLAEGVAVWASGGHYEAQDLQRRAAALLVLNEYIPLAELTDKFYQTQHETGYLEAGAFVDYLVSRYGWSDVREFYSDTAASNGATDVEALDSNLQDYFGLSLAEMEAEWLARLQAITPTAEEVSDLETSIRYYETARHYQKLFDPTAYFRTAWLPLAADVVAQGNAADFLRYPRTETNLTLEVMLKAAYEAMNEQDYSRANVLLDSIERFLNQDGASVDPLVSSYRDIVQTAVAFGYEPQRVTLKGDAAEILATTASGNSLIDLEVELRSGDWILLAN